MKNETVFIRKGNAYFSNDFAHYAQLGFRKPRQLLLFMAIVSQLNPMEDKLEGWLSIPQITELIKGDKAKRSGSLHSEIVASTEEMMESNYAKFDTDILIHGKPLPRYINIFDQLTPEKAADGTIWYHYKLSAQMRPYLKHLTSKFVQIRVPVGTQCGAAIRFLLLAQAHHNKMRQHSKITKMRLSIGDLKHRLRMENNYPRFADFRRRVLESMVQGVNDSGSLKIVKYELIRQSRGISHIEFYFEDAVNRALPAPKDLPFETPIPALQAPLSVPIIEEQPTTEVLQASPQKPLVEAAKKTAPKTALAQVSSELLEQIQQPKDYIPSATDLERLSFAQTKAYDFLVKKGCKKGIVFRQIVQKMPSSEYLGWEDIFVQKAWSCFAKVCRQKEASARAAVFVSWWKQGEFKTRLFPNVMELVQTVKRSKSPQEWTNRTTAKGMTYNQFKRWYQMQQHLEAKQ